MPVFYVSPNGNDLTGDGSLVAPFATLKHVLGLTGSPGYILIDSTTIYLLSGTHVVDIPLSPASVKNLKIVGYPGANPIILHTSTGQPLFDFINNEGLELSNFSIKTETLSPVYVKITNCNLSKLVNIKINNNEINSPGDVSIIQLINTYTDLLNCEIKNNSFNGNVKVIDLYNANISKIDKCNINNISGAEVTGIYINPSNLDITITNGDIKKLIGTSNSYGIFSNFSGTSTNLLIDEISISECTFGMYIKNNTYTHRDKLRIRRFELFKNIYNLVLDAASGSVYNGVFAKSNFGLYARTSSTVELYNCIFYSIKDIYNLSNTAAIRASDSSNVKVSYSDFYQNTTMFQEASNGNIIKGEYIRFINPQFVNESADNYALLDTSPLVDSGAPVDFMITGVAPDFGRYDIDRLVPSDEIPALAAKIVTRTYRAYDIGRVDVQQLIQDIMQAVDANLIAKEGTAINDLMVKPHGILYQRLLDAIMMIARNQSILAADLMTSQELDAFAANHYINRIPGTLATVTARIYTDTPVNMRITPQDVFIAGALRFYPRQYIEITAGEMAMNIEGMRYFVDVPLEAETFGTNYNIKSGELTEWLGAPSVVKEVVNLVDAFPGRDEEDNESLIERVKFSIGNRTLINPVGIRAVILDTFPEIRRVVPIGAGDPEMTRDIFLNIHFYGKTDIYVSATELAVGIYDIIEAQQQTQLNRTTIGDIPILDLLEVRVLDPDTREPTDLILDKSKYSLLVTNPENRFSIYDNLIFEIHPDYVNTNLRLMFRWSPEILLVHNYCQSDDARVLCEDIRVKHLIPVFLSTQIVYKSIIELDEADIIRQIKEFINTFPPEEEFQVSDLIDILYRNGADFVEQPVTVQAVYHHQNGVIETKYFINTNTIPRIYGYIADNISIQSL